jgi:hypothetical protein
MNFLLSNGSTLQKMQHFKLDAVIEHAIKQLPPEVYRFREYIDWKFTIPPQSFVEYATAYIIPGKRC